MQLDAIYDDGRLVFKQSVRLKDGPIEVRLSVPDGAVLNVGGTDEQRPHVVPEETTQRAQALLARLREIREQPSEGPEPELTDRQRERLAAFELREKDE